MKEHISAQLFDSSKRHRLRLIFVEAESTRGYNFSRLDWHSRSGNKWHLEASISRDSFQKSGAPERWISDIHDIDPNNNSCLIKIAEGEKQLNGHTSYIYSWREWSLRSNTEVRFVKFCENIWEGPLPLEELEHITEQGAAANP